MNDKCPHCGFPPAVHRCPYAPPFLGGQGRRGVDVYETGKVLGLWLAIAFALIVWLVIWRRCSL